MFSVIIPLYNKAQSIENTLRSVLNQTFQEFEILVVNDGSTDASANLVKMIDDPRIRLLEQENQGVSAARNSGIEKATYEWISFLDGDDLWERDHLAEIVEMIKVFPSEKVYVTSFKFSDNRKMFRCPRKTDIFAVDNYFKDAMKELLIWTSIIVVHKDCFNQIGRFNTALSRGEDLDVWARLAREYKIIKSKKITAIYKVDSEHSLSAGKSKYEKSILSVISLKGLIGDERRYFKRMLINRLKKDVKGLDVKELFRILLKHNLQLLF